MRKLIWITILIVCVTSTMWSQMRATEDPLYFPRDFTGSDPIALFDNLSNLLTELKVIGKSNAIIERAVQKKLIYGNSTVNDRFFLQPDESSFISGTNVNDILTRYRAQRYRLVETGEFPEPVPNHNRCTGGTGMGSGRSGPRINNRYELVDDFAGFMTIGAIWRKSTISLKTVPLNDFGNNYKGVKSPNCQNGIFVQSPQVHYELGFDKAQPFRLIEMGKKDISAGVYEFEYLRVPGTIEFSLKTYEYEEVRGPGIAAFLPDSRSGVNLSQPEPKYPDVIFVVKLVPPYVKTETVSMFDTFENRPNQAIRKTLVVDIIGIWQYDRSTGVILSKDAGQVVNLASYKLAKPKSKPHVAAAALATQPLRIISKPRPEYTAEAKKRNIQGTVQLKITFLASGKIGPVVSIQGLPYGLTSQAIDAAKKIQFEPAKRNGVPYTMTRILAYGFTIY